MNYIKRNITPLQQQIAKHEQFYYEEMEDIILRYDAVVQAVSEGMDKIQAYYTLVRILYDVKKIYDIWKVGEIPAFLFFLNTYI